MEKQNQPTNETTEQIAQSVEPQGNRIAHVCDLILQLADKLLKGSTKQTPAMQAAAEQVIALIEAKAKGRKNVTSAMAAARKAYGLPEQN